MKPAILFGLSALVLALSITFLTPAALPLLGLVSLPLLALYLIAIVTMCCLAVVLLSRHSAVGNRLRMTLAGSLLLALAACGTTATTAFETALSDAKAIIALNLLPTNVSSIASLVITGLETLDGSYNASVASGATPENTTLALLATSVGQVQANVSTTSKVYADATTALDVIQLAQANSSSSYKAQVESDVGTLLIDYLAANQPASGAVGASPSAYAALLSDARAHLSK